jgi:RHS repeat-associated protein
MTNASSGPVYGALNSFLSSVDTNTTVAPKAYLNWLLLDNQLNEVAGKSGAIPVGQADVLNTLAKGIKLDHSGFLYIWVSNETPNWPAFFDNLSVEHLSGSLLEESHVYPFGLTMAGISDKALKGNYAENKYKYNGKELQNKEFADGTGLEEYDYGARFYDQQIGRFNVQDRFAERYQTFSTYQYAANNPMKYVDVNGDSLWINFSITTTGDDGKKVTSSYRLYYQADEDGTYDFYNPKTGKVYDGPRNDFLDNVKVSLAYLINNGLGKEPIEITKDQNENIDIKESHSLNFNGFRSDEKTIYYNPYSARETPDGQRTIPSFDFGHELRHAWNFVKDRENFDIRNRTPDANYPNLEEKNVTEQYEWPNAQRLGMPKVEYTNRGNQDVWTAGPISSATGPDRTPAPVLPKHNKNRKHEN